jgi:antitoxin HigA-1
MRDLICVPIHPGEVLGEVYMRSVQPPLTVHDVADSVNVPPKELVKFLAGQRSVTMPLAARLAMRFRTTTAYWIGLQSLYDNQSQAVRLAPGPHRITKTPR